MSSKKTLRLISLGMFIIAAVFVAVALSHPEMGGVFYIGKFQVNASHWQVCYNLYAIIMVAFLVMSFTKVSTIVAINIALTLLVLVGNVFYQSMAMTYPIKLVCSGGFMLMGIVNLIYALKTKCKRVILMVIMGIGMIFAFGGDFAINQEFVSGVISFALGHIFFVIAYLMYRKISKIDIIISILWGIMAVVFILFCPYFVFRPEVFKYLCATYAAIISVMVGKSLGNAIVEKSFYTILIAVASVLFFFSDVALVLAWFSILEQEWLGYLCMALYYPALVLLGWSMLIYIYNNKKVIEEV